MEDSSPFKGGVCSYIAPGQKHYSFSDPGTAWVSHLSHFLSVSLALSHTRVRAHAATRALAFGLSHFLSLSSCLPVCLPLGLCLSLLSKSGLTHVCGQMVLWFFFLRDLALLTHQQLFHTKHAALNLSANHHPPTPQFFHRSCPFVTVTLFYLSPSSLPSKFHSPSFCFVFSWLWVQS